MRTVPVLHTLQASSGSSLPDPVHDRWPAHLDLEVSPRGERSVLTRMRHEGPLRVQRSFHPESSGACHVYVLHPPGGVAGGDRLEIRVHVNADARALVTSPAAQKLYRCPERSSEQHVKLSVHSGCLEWLPQETIAFDGARSQSLLEVDLDAEARFVGWEILCLGRPASGESFRRGRLEQRLELRRAGRPLWSERLVLEPGLTGEVDLFRSAWGLRGCTVLGTLVCTPGASDEVEAVRATVRLRSGEHFSASAPRGLVVCRFLGTHAWRARSVLESAWNVLRPRIAGGPAVAPRIWST